MTRLLSEHGARGSVAIACASCSVLKLLPAALLLLAGCGQAPKERGTGAREAVEHFYGALLRKDWPTAYAALDADSRSRGGTDQFARRAESYRRSLGFEPERVNVRACEEHGSTAIAHLVLTGRTAVKQRTYKDAVALCKSGTSWGVVLPR